MQSNDVIGDAGLHDLGHINIAIKYEVLDVLSNVILHLTLTFRTSLGQSDGMVHFDLCERLSCRSLSKFCRLKIALRNDICYFVVWCKQIIPTFSTSLRPSVSRSAKQEFSHLGCGRHQIQIPFVFDWTVDPRSNPVTSNYKCNMRGI